MKYIHTIDIGDGKCIAFFPNSFRFFVVLTEQAEQLAAIAKHIENPSSGEAPYPQNDSYSKAIKLLKECVESKSWTYDRSVLPRLVLNISNDCNLRCEYCYASGGNYTGKRQQMTIDTLVSALNSFYNYFDEIESIQLFGGEPTMNIPAIKYVCEYVRRNAYKTSIGIVTNGTIMPDSLLHLIEEYDIHVTVSVDIDTIHNEARPYVSGKGSFQNIHRTIGKLKSIGQPEKFEVTYTQLHTDKGYSIFDVVSALTEQYGINNVHLAPVSTSLEKYQLRNMDSFIGSVDDFLNGKELKTAPYSLLKTMIASLKTKQTNQYICFAGFGTIAVSSDGKIYPCFYFCENADFEFGSVYDNKGAFAKSIEHMQNKYVQYNRFDKPECQDCFAIKVCRGCLGDNYYETGNEYTASENVCNMTRGMLERVLINMARMNNKLKGE